ncbi:MAG: NUDIX domain-containing protein [Crocinitomicaceae bacterium]
MELNSFNLRVYGLLIHDDHVLITHERRSGVEMTKFPGGGLEFGEGIKDCLKREFQEELEIEIEVKDFYFVNDFLQISAYRGSDQLISFYYKVESNELNKIVTEKKRTLGFNEQIFEWIPITALKVEEFTFPIDKKVVEMLIA